MQEKLVHYLIDCLDSDRIDAEFAEATQDAQAQECGLETFTYWFSKFDLYLLEFYPELTPTPRRPPPPARHAGPGRRNSLMGGISLPGTSGRRASLNGGLRMLQGGGGRRRSITQPQSGPGENAFQQALQGSSLAHELMAPRALPSVGGGSCEASAPASAYSA